MIRVQSVRAPVGGDRRTISDQLRGQGFARDWTLARAWWSPVLDFRRITPELARLHEKIASPASARVFSRELFTSLDCRSNSSLSSEACRWHSQLPARRISPLSVDTGEHAWKPGSAGRETFPFPLPSLVNRGEVASSRLRELQGGLTKPKLRSNGSVKHTRTQAAENGGGRAQSSPRGNRFSRNGGIRLGGPR